MNKFTFEKKEPKLLKVEISGRVYAFNPYTLAVKKASEKFVMCQQPLVNRLKNKNLSQRDLDELVLKACTNVRDTVNAILGKNAYNQIFHGRTVDFEEHQELMTFIFEEIAAFAKADKLSDDREPITE